MTMVAKTKAAHGKLTKCFVCNKMKATVAKNYGVQSCSGCKSLFRRVCIGEKGLENCESENQNCTCDSCRYKKCLNAGMNEMYLREDNAVGGRRTPYLKQPCKKKRTVRRKMEGPLREMQAFHPLNQNSTKENSKHSTDGASKDFFRTENSVGRNKRKRLITKINGKQDSGETSSRMKRENVLTDIDEQSISFMNDASFMKDTNITSYLPIPPSLSEGDDLLDNLQQTQRECDPILHEEKLQEHEEHQRIINKHDKEKEQIVEHVRQLKAECEELNSRKLQEHEEHQRIMNEHEKEKEQIGEHVRQLKAECEEINSRKLQEHEEHQRIMNKHEKEKEHIVEHVRQLKAECEELNSRKLQEHEEHQRIIDELKKNKEQFEALNAKCKELNEEKKQLNMIKSSKQESIKVLSKEKVLLEEEISKCLDDKMYIRSARFFKDKSMRRNLGLSDITELNNNLQNSIDIYKKIISSFVTYKDSYDHMNIADIVRAIDDHIINLQFDEARKKYRKVILYSYGSSKYVDFYMKLDNLICLLKILQNAQETPDSYSFDKVSQLIEDLKSKYSEKIYKNAIISGQIDFLRYVLKIKMNSAALTTITELLTADIGSHQNWIYFEYGKLLFKNQNYREARQYMIKAIEHEPKTENRSIILEDYKQILKIEFQHDKWSIMEHEKCSKADLRKIYKKLALYYHPDKNCDRNEEHVTLLMETLKYINQAYIQLNKELQ